MRDYDDECRKKIELPTPKEVWDRKMSRGWAKAIAMFAVFLVVMSPVLYLISERSDVNIELSHIADNYQYMRYLIGAEDEGEMGDEYTTFHRSLRQQLDGAELNNDRLDEFMISLKTLGSGLLSQFEILFATESGVFIRAFNREITLEELNGIQQREIADVGRMKMNTRTSVILGFFLFWFVIAVLLLIYLRRTAGGPDLVFEKVGDQVRARVVRSPVD